MSITGNLAKGKADKYLTFACFKLQTAGRNGYHSTSLCLKFNCLSKKYIWIYSWLNYISWKIHLNNCSVILNAFGGMTMPNMSKLRKRVDHSVPSSIQHWVVNYVDVHIPYTRVNKRIRFFLKLQGNMHLLPIMRLIMMAKIDHTPKTATPVLTEMSRVKEIVDVVPL